MKCAGDTLKRKETDVLEMSALWLENQLKAKAPDHAGRRVVQSDLQAGRIVLAVVLDQCFTPETWSQHPLGCFCFWMLEALRTPDADVPPEEVWTDPVCDEI